MPNYKPKDPFWFQQRLYSPDKIYPADDYQVVTNPDLFENVDDIVEQATAAPGEKRARPRRKPAKQRKPADG
jgi:hypothetical protein